MKRGRATGVAVRSRPPVAGSTPPPTTPDESGVRLIDAWPTLAVWPLRANLVSVGRWWVYNALMPRHGYWTYADTLDALRVKLEATAAAWLDRARAGRLRNPESSRMALSVKGREASIRRASAKRASERRVDKAFDESLDD